MSQPAHLSTEQIADLLAANLPANEAVTANAHLVECADCAQARQALEDVTGLLVEVAAEPMAMPPDVADRLRAALAEASSERSAGVRRLEPTESSDTRRPMRWLMGAAAAVVVLGVGVASLKALPNDDGSVAGSAAAGQSRGAPAGQDMIQSGMGGSEGTSGVPGASGQTESDAQGYRTFPAAKPGRLPNLDPSVVESAAAGLSLRPSAAVPPSAVGCAVPLADASVTSAVRFDDQQAVLAIMRATRTVTIYDCKTGTRALFTSGY